MAKAKNFMVITNPEEWGLRKVLEEEARTSVDRVKVNV